jgi:hypothetical protein
MATEPVRPLQLVDSERFNRLIDTLQQTLGRKEIVEQATASPQEQAYVRSYYDAIKSVKNKSPLAGMDVINLLNKKDRFKGSLAAKAHLPQPPGDDGPVVAGSPKKKKRVGGMSVEGSETKIKNFFKDQGVKKANAGTIVHRGTRYELPYDDFIHDLTHDFTRTRPTLTDQETKTGLNLLKKIRIPTSHIRSNRLRSKYTALREGSNSGTIATPKYSTPPSTSRLPIPVRPNSAPQLIRNHRGASRFPELYNRRSRPRDTSQLDHELGNLLRKR